MFSNPPLCAAASSFWSWADLLFYLLSLTIPSIPHVVMLLTKHLHQKCREPHCGVLIRLKFDSDGPRCKQHTLRTLTVIPTVIPT